MVPLAALYMFLQVLASTMISAPASVHVPVVTSRIDQAPALVPHLPALAKQYTLAPWQVLPPHSHGTAFEDRPFGEAHGVADTPARTNSSAVQTRHPDNILD